MPLTLLILNTSHQAAEELKVSLSNSHDTHLLGERDNPERFLADVALLQPSGAIVVLTRENPEAEFTFIKKLVSSNPNLAVITASSDCSSSIILRSMRSGAHEFLQLPVVEEELRTVIERVKELGLGSENAATHKGRIVAVYSGKGGAGVSFLATNLSAAMDGPTLLADLNLQAGDAASFLGLDPRYSVLDFVNNRARLDDALISSFIAIHSPRLSLLAAPPEAHEAEDIKPQDVTEILHLFRQRFSCIVLDLPHTFDPITVAALDLADDILAVMTLDIPGIRSTHKALKVFNRLGYAKPKIHLVVNRWSKNIDIQLQKVESHLNEEIMGFIPNDYRKVMDSINLGNPLVHSEPSSKISTEIKRIASLVTSEGNFSSPQTRKGLLPRVFGREEKGSTSPLHLAPMLDKA